MIYLIILTKIIIKLSLNGEVIYYFSFGTFAFLATFVHPFFYAFHFTEMIFRFDKLKNIV